MVILTLRGAALPSAPTCAPPVFGFVLTNPPGRTDRDETEAPGSFVSVAVFQALSRTSRQWTQVTATVDAGQEAQLRPCVISF